MTGSDPWAGLAGPGAIDHRHVVEVAVLVDGLNDSLIGSLAGLATPGLLLRSSLAHGPQTRCGKSRLCNIDLLPGQLDQGRNWSRTHALPDLQATCIHGNMNIHIKSAWLIPVDMRDVVKSRGRD